MSAFALITPTSVGSHYERVPRFRRSNLGVAPPSIIESLVHSAEGGNFDSIYALHHRTIRDERVLTDLIDTLWQFPQFGKNPSPRIKKALQDAQADWSSCFFPGCKESRILGTRDPRAPHTHPPAPARICKIFICSNPYLTRVKRML